MVTVFETGEYSLKDTLDCGQCFRFTGNGDGSHTGTACGRLLTLSQDGDRVTVRGAYGAEEADGIADFLALRDDYDGIREILCRDERMARIVSGCPGIRILRQDWWETLATFLISQNNNIPRIRAIVERLCREYGARGGDGALLFPAPETLARLEPEDLNCLKCGYRAPYLVDAARKAAEGVLREEDLKRLPLEEARRLLGTVRGVGPKVADCVLLFGAHRLDAFPVDVWIRRAMDAWFPDGLPGSVLPYAGIAQQYMFHYIRTRGTEL